MCPDKIAFWGTVLFQCEVESVFNIMYQKPRFIYLKKFVNLLKVHLGVGAFGRGSVLPIVNK